MKSVINVFIDLLVALILLAMVLCCATGVVALWGLFVHTVHSVF